MVVVIPLIEDVIQTQSLLVLSFKEIVPREKTNTSHLMQKLCKLKSSSGVKCTSLSWESMYQNMTQI